MDYIVIDNLLSSDKADEIENLMNTLKWDKIPYGGSPKEFGWVDGVHYDKEQFQCIIDETEHEKIVTEYVADKIKEHLGDRVFVSAKFNKVGPPDIEWVENIHGGPHIDSTAPGLLSALYYVNDSDGDTFLYDQVWDIEDIDENPKELTLKTRVSPKKNRLIIFNGHNWHSAGVPSSGIRYALNMNWSDPIDWTNVLFEDTATGEMVKIC